MLSGETAAGKHPVEAVRYMNNIALETEKNLDLTDLTYNLRDFKNIDLKDDLSYKKAIDYSVCVTSNLLNAAAIISVTSDGLSPIILSSYRPKAPIFAITKSERVARNLSLIWNVQSVFVPEIKISMTKANNETTQQNFVEKFLLNPQKYSFGFCSES